MPSELITLTVNPSLDVSTDVDHLVPTRKLRCGAPLTEPGGGGVNVARAARRLGTEATAVITSGGPYGADVERLLAKEGVPVVAVAVEGATRMSFSVSETATGQQFRFNLPGPTLQARDHERLEAELEALAPTGWFVMSGALAPGLPEDLYARLSERLRARGVRVALDTSGPALRRGLEAGVDIAKPNVNELESLVGRRLVGEADFEAAALTALRMGPNGAIVVSLGPAGALVVSPEHDHGLRVPAPAIRVRSTIGAGDSMVAGMVVALSRGADLAHAVRFGVAAGTATSARPGTQLCDADSVAELLAFGEPQDEAAS